MKTAASCHRLSCRKCERELRTLSHGAIHGDLTAMGFYDLTSYRQTHPTARNGAAFRRAVKLLENSTMLILWNAWSGILDPDRDNAARLPCADNYRRPWARILERI